MDDWQGYEKQITHFQIDSRKIGRGDLFCALEGEKTDGHKYVEEAFGRGATCALVRKCYKKNVPYEKRLIRVEDPLQTLQKEAKKRLKREKMVVIGITGSLGKTTTKEFLKTLLEKRFDVYASPKNYNSQVGLPLSILNAPKNKTHGVFEMAMTEKGNIQKLVEIAPPDIALINNVSYVHIENFSGLEGIWEAKKEIFSHPKTEVRIMHESLRRYDQDPQIQTFSTVAPLYPLPFSEKQFVWNFMAARSIAKALGLEEEDIQERVQHLQAPKMRFEKAKINGILWINDAYNSSVDSTRFALESLPQVSGKKWALLGPMAELGRYNQVLHEEVGRLSAKYADTTFSFGDEGKWIVDACRKEGGLAKHFPSKRAFFLESMRAPKKGDVVLVKASRKYALEQLFSFFS